MEQQQCLLQVGTKVIRKADARKGVACFGKVECIQGTKATVYWEYMTGNRQHRGHIALVSLIAVTPEMEQEIIARQKVRLEARRAAADAERIYLCTNVNPQSRVSNDGHPKPLPLLVSQVVNGKCFYCGAPVVLREQGEREKETL